MLGMVVKNSPTPVPTIAPMMINNKKMIVSLLLFKKGSSYNLFALYIFSLHTQNPAIYRSFPITENEQVDLTAYLLAYKSLCITDI